MLQQLLYKISINLRDKIYGSVPTSSEWKDKTQMCRLVVRRMLFLLCERFFNRSKSTQDFVMVTYLCQDLVLTNEKSSKGRFLKTA